MSALDGLVRDELEVRFTGAGTGTAPLTWGQKAILADMRATGGQFSMGGSLELPPGATIADAARRYTDLIARHPALRMRLGADCAGQPAEQTVAASGRARVHVLAVPDGLDPAGLAAHAERVRETWALDRFDFARDWPLRMAVLRRGDTALYLVWVLSHLAADGGAHVLLLGDLLDPAAAGRPRPSLLDLARAEAEPAQRRASAGALRYWADRLRDLPEYTFGPPRTGAGPAAERYQQARFTSVDAQRAVAAVAERTGTDAARVTLAVIATAVARTTGVNPLPIKVTVNNRFRPGLAEAIAPIAQNSVIAVECGGAALDEIVARVRAATLVSGMRAYYDPDDLDALAARLDTERGHPAALTFRINDQRRMVGRGDERVHDLAAPPHSQGRPGETTLTRLGPRDDVREQVSIIVENRLDALSLRLMWDTWSLDEARAEALLRAVEEIAVAAAPDQATSNAARHR